MKAFDRLKKARTQIQTDFPFFAYLSLYVKFGKEETEGVDTIGIDGEGNMYYNESWICNLDNDELKAVLVHETLHLAFVHMLRRGTRNPEIWNLSGDLAINSILVENKMTLPKGIVPDKKGDFEFKGLFKKIINCKGKPAEVLYDEIYKEVENEEKQKGNSDGDNDGDDGNGESEYDKRFDKHIFKARGKEIKDLSEEDKAELEKNWIQRVNEAYVACKLRGTMPLGIELLIGKLHESKINWKQKLIQVIQSYIPSDFSYSRCNKKSISTGIFMPDFDKERIEVSIAIDTSGSIGQEELNDFISEIVGIAKAYKDKIEMKLYCHDVIVQSDYKVENGSIEKIKQIKIVGRGGTSHIEVMNRIAKDSRECKLAVFFTDGDSDLSEIDFGKYRYGKLFILNKDGNDEQLKNKQAQVIKLK